MNILDWLLIGNQLKNKMQEKQKCALYETIRSGNVYAFSQVISRCYMHKKK